MGVDSAGVVVYGGCRFSRCGGVWYMGVDSPGVVVYGRCRFSE